MHSTRLPTCLCPHCGGLLGGATGTSREAPTPGAWGLCHYCGTILQFDDSLRLVLPPIGALEALGLIDPDLLRLLQRMGEDLRRSPRPGLARQAPH